MKPIRILPLLAACLLGVSSPVALAQPAPALSASELAEKLVVSRNGAEVLVTWKVPLDDVFGIDVLRNTQAEPRGRVRLAFVGSTKNTYLDTVPDAEATYWYWIKVTLNDRSAYNLGPVSSAPAKVWTP